ncbi:MAG: hypothetical protein ACKVHO_06805 [Verrucomicrobiia bacterium]|jgi:hypothetical protein
MKMLDFTGSTADEIAQFILQARLEFKAFRRVVIEPGLTRIIDINRNEIRFPDISYGNELLNTVVKEAGGSFSPTTLHDEPPNDAKRKEVRCSARYAWGNDRIC